jgi:hypothetical protein
MESTMESDSWTNLDEPRPQRGGQLSLLRCSDSSEPATDSSEPRRL